MPQFVAIDFETAAADVATICQIGIAVFADGEEPQVHERLIDPECRFDRANIAVHGIRAQQVKGEPTLPDLYPWFRGLLENQVIVCHTEFDRNALSGALQRYKLDSFPCIWIDSSKVARRTWTQYAQRGFNLGNLAANFGIEFRHHTAGDDARVAGLVLLRALADSGLPLERWISAAPKGYNPSQWIDRTAYSRTGARAQSPRAPASRVPETPPRQPISAPVVHQPGLRSFWGRMRDVWNEQNAKGRALIALAAFLLLFVCPCCALTNLANPGATPTPTVVATPSVPAP